MLKVTYLEEKGFETDFFVEPDKIHTLPPIQCVLRVEIPTPYINDMKRYFKNVPIRVKGDFVNYYGDMAKFILANWNQ